LHRKAGISERNWLSTWGAIPDIVRVVNPVWRQLDSKIRRLNGKRQRDRATFAFDSMLMLYLDHGYAVASHNSQ
jgi:hypothetical protein